MQSDFSAPPDTVEDVERELVHLADALERGMARWLALVAEFDHRDGARRWGFRGTAEWLAWRCGIGPRAARDHVRVARRLTELPLVRAAFACGELTYSKVRALTRAAASEDEAALLQMAASATAGQLERILATLRSAPSANVEMANRGHHRRRLDWWWEHDGTLRLYGQLGADDGAAVVEAIEAGAEGLHPAYNPDDDQPRPPLGARRADALTEIVFSGAPPAQVVLHVDADALACRATAADQRQGEVCALEHGPAIPSQTARRLACDAEVILAQHQTDGTIDHGRRRRVVSPALRTALERRDRHCRYPGCTRSHGVHAHHIQHWAHGGTTDKGNLVLLCRYHHRLVHEDGFTIQRPLGELAFFRPDGTAVPTNPTAPPRQGRHPPVMLAA